MSTVKVVVGAASVELESSGTPVQELAELAVQTLRQAQTADQQATQEQTTKAGQYI